MSATKLPSMTIARLRRTCSSWACVGGAGPVERGRYCARTVPVGPPRLPATEVLAVKAAAPITIRVATAHAIRAWVARTSAVKLSEKFAATQPPAKALITPDTAHHAKTAQVTAFGALSAVATSIDNSPKPNPAIRNSTWKMSEAITPALTADQLQPAKV